MSSAPAPRTALTMWVQDADAHVISPCSKDGTGHVGTRCRDKGLQLVVEALDAVQPDTKPLCFTAPTCSSWGSC